MDLELRTSLSSNYRKHTAANPVQRALIDRFHRKIVREVVALSPQTFLDAGCGEGFVARRVIDALPGIELTGCDVSDEALEMAADANPGATFVVGSVVDLPFPDRSFDVVGCFEVLSIYPAICPDAHCPSWRASLVMLSCSACRTSRCFALLTRRAGRISTCDPKGATRITSNSGHDRRSARSLASSSSFKSWLDLFHGRSALPRCRVDRRTATIRASSSAPGSQGDWEIKTWTFENGAAVFAVM